MNVMTKRGSQDNVVTYEHYCDTKEDLTAIPNDQITLGSTAVVLKDEGDAMGVYIANSSKEWIPFSSIGNAGDGSSGGSTGGVMVVKITSDETAGEDTFDHTWQEMYDSIANGVPVLVLVCVVDVAFTDTVSLEKIAENIFMAHLGNGDEYTCNDPDGYPTHGGGDDGGGDDSAA